MIIEIHNIYNPVRLCMKYFGISGNVAGMKEMIDVVKKYCISHHFSSRILPVQNVNNHFGKPQKSSDWF